MSDQFYNWRRFWCPREGGYSLQDGGYLADPEAQWGQAYNPQLVTFDKIAAVPCLALLGEPGIGKSWAAQASFDAAGTQAEADGEKMLWVDLRSCGCEQRVIQKVFEGREFQDWAAGTHRLHLFLDSLDECLLRVDTVAALLLDELPRYPRERLALRLMCRTADWPRMLELGLPPLWGQEDLRAYELAPLRRADVVAAAEAHGIDADGFLQEVERAGAEPLAIKPITLRFLLNTYARGGRLPATQAELYREGCRVLCEETSDSRLAAHARGLLGPDQRLAAAARIAAVTRFANRYAVYTGPDLGDVPEGALSVRELCGGREGAGGSGFAVTEQVVREALATGLFSGRGPDLMGWAHQTYAEYLAARYVAEHRMPPAQTLGLITQPADPGQRLVPQLQETAAWMAGQDPAVFRALMETDPQALLLSDVATAADRAALTSQLLASCERGDLSVRGLRGQRRLSKLAHPRLAAQLRPYLADRNKNEASRWAAIDIAEACRDQGLQTDLSGIALDATEPILLRVQAAYAVARVGDAATRSRMLPLAREEAGNDPDDELKGCGLMAVWPEHLAASELFPLLTTPKTELFGSYRSFFHSGFGRQIPPADLPRALAWVEAQEPDLMSLHAFAEPMEEILQQAWEHLHAPSVLDAFAKVALKRMKNHEAVMGPGLRTGRTSPLYESQDKRHSLVLAMAAHIGEAEAVTLVSSPTPLLLNDDAPWLLQLVGQARTEREERLYARLVRLTFSWQRLDYLDDVRAAAATSPALAREFSFLLEPVRLDSPEAEYQRDILRRENELERRNAQRPLDPPPAARVRDNLDRFEAGDLSAWWLLNLDMTLKPDSRHYGDELTPDLTSLPGWEEADAGTRDRIVRAAREYLVGKVPNPEEWVGTDTLDRPDLAGYRALALLALQRPEAVAGLPSGVWLAWAPVILAYPITGSGGGAALHQGLVAIAYGMAPDAIISTLLRLIDKDNEQHGHIFILDAADRCWDARLAQALADKLGDTALEPAALGSLLGSLLAHDAADTAAQATQARAVAEAMVASAARSEAADTDDWGNGLAVAAELLAGTTDAGWPVVWPAVFSNTEFGRQLSERVAQQYHRSARVHSRLSADQLADLYLWLEAQYPHAEDPQHKGAYHVGPREAVADWRDGILSHLQERGTPQACRAIFRLMGELPEFTWLRDLLRHAQEVMRRMTWTPLRPEDLLKIADDPSKRLVQSADELLLVVQEALGRLQAKLQGETPTAQFLWNRLPDGAYRPKDEEAFSDYVKVFLVEDLRGRGVVVNREVQIRRGQGTTKGQDTDIHVDAVTRASQDDVADTVSVIIEAKGNWHRELRTAMETQLVGRYLEDNDCHHGLYLVGWFQSPTWDAQDARQRNVPQITLEAARAELEDQARALSARGRHIAAVALDLSI